jgi:type III secretory pathway component EscR
MENDYIYKGGNDMDERIEKLVLIAYLSGYNMSEISKAFSIPYVIVENFIIDHLPLDYES